MDSGRVLATGTPANSSRRAAPPRSRTLSSAISKRRRDRASWRPRRSRPRREAAAPARSAPPSVPCSARGACFAYTIRETLELLRDPIRLGFSLFGTALLMLVFGFGVSTDVNNLSFAVLDHDQSHESRAYLEELQGLELFRREGAARRLCRSRKSSQKRRHQGRHRNPARLRPRHQARTAGLGRRLGRRRHAVPRRRPSAAICRRMHAALSDRSGGEDDGARRAAARRYRNPVQIQSGLRQHLRDGARRSCRCCWRCFPAILMALAVVREKELGSITNLYVTPVTRIEFLVGKQLPYIGVAMAQFRLDVPDGAVRLPGSAERQLSWRCCWACWSTSPR